jgi:hypothetical protein
MDHDGARRLMAEAMEGRIGADEERDLALHLVGCEDCKAVYEGLQHANPALTSIQLGEPSAEALDAAVHRATTVLRGEADPGLMGLSDEPPGLPEELDPNTVRIDSGSRFDEPDLQPAGPMIATGPLMTPEPTGAVRPLSPPEAHVRAIEAEAEPVDEPAAYEPPPLVADLPPLVPALIASDEGDEEPPLLAPDFLPTEQVSQQVPEPGLEREPELEPAQRSEIETLLEEDRTRFEPLPYEDEDDDREGPGPGPWLVAIAVTVILAVLAGFLIFRGQGFLGGGGGELPSADEVRSRVQRAFLDMKSLKTSFDIQKLSLYRIGREEDALRYSFSTGRWQGSIDYDRSEGYKQSFSLEVAQDEVQRAEIVQKTEETRSLVGSGDGRNFLVEQNPPLGPPDGALRPTLGLLEDTLGTAAGMIAGADDLEVVRRTEKDGRQLYEVRASVTPTELTRADTIEAALDGNNYMPVVIRRTITRANARVLGPADALSDADLDKAFGDNDKIATEIVELSNVQYDEIVLPGDLTLEAPDSVEEQSRDAKFERITRAELGTKLDFEPLLPKSLPGEFEEQLFAVYTGEPKNWGPGNTYPKPESVFHSQYFDGRSTIVLTQRRMPATFKLTGSPLRAGLPITVDEVTRDDKTFFYGTSPEVPPHVYGFVGDVFVMASGYATQDELVGMIASLAETPVDIPGPLTSGSPGLSPSPGASPATTSAPIVTATP